MMRVLNFFDGDTNVFTSALFAGNSRLTELWHMCASQQPDQAIAILLDMPDQLAALINRFSNALDRSAPHLRAQAIIDIIQGELVALCKLLILILPLVDSAAINTGTQGGLENIALLRKDSEEVCLHKWLFFLAHWATFALEPVGIVGIIRFVVGVRHQFIKPRRALSGVHNCTAAACCASRRCC